MIAKFSKISLRFISRNSFYCHPQYVNNIQRRNLGIMDKISDFAYKRADNKKEQKFKDMIDEMANSTNWTLKHMKKTVDEESKSWLRYIPGASDSHDMKELNMMKDIFNAMTESELEDTKLIVGVAKERIIKSSGRSMDDLNRILWLHKQSSILHKWIRLKSSKGEKLPNDHIELHYMQERDPRMAKLTQEAFGKPKRGKGRGF